MVEGNEKKGIADEVKDIRTDYKKPGLPSDIPEKAKKDMKKTREQLEKFKKAILKKYPFTMGLGILPPQSAEKFEDMEDVPEEERKKKPIHLMMLIPEEKFKEINKIKLDLINQIKDMKPKIWLHVKTPVDVWEYCFDGKYGIVSAISMAFPLYDTGLLGGLRVAEIHKTLILRKFEKYVVSYVIAGSLVRGDSSKTSDVDVYIIIDDTDVKRMPRLELKERLRNIINSYVVEASELAGVKNKLSPQVYLLTDFWESVKDAHPVIFTFIRDGVPLYDRGAFMPWKLLLKMGKIKPSPESIEMFMGMGDKTTKNVKRTLLDLVIGDIYWGVLTPSQALLMLYGLPPPTPKETPKIFRETFVEKEKLLEKKYAQILERIVKIYKDYEHEKVKEIKGAEVDKFLADAEEYMKRLKELREQIEKRSNEKTIEQIHHDVFQLLIGIFGKKAYSSLVKDFEGEFIRKGKLPESYLKILKELVRARKEFKKGKMAKHEVEYARKNASLIINSLIEFSQRCELLSLQKGKLKIKTKDKTYNLVLTSTGIFLIDGNKIQRVVNKLVNSTVDDLNKALASQEKDVEIKIDEKVFGVLRKELGSFEVIL